MNQFIFIKVISGRETETAFVYDGEIILTYMSSTNKPFLLCLLILTVALENLQRKIFTVGHH